ncbi:MAG: hypothetical protein K0S22_246 [Oscillospiraceae bacterium]|nr:hypothetical protein [Oscillospiraceae bacterium]
MNKKGYPFFLTVMTWGALWGIFEATVGYLLHLFEIKITWLIWYPVACFFMANVYRQTRRRSSVLYIGIMCASIKMLNLLTPIRVDKVINPAISIIFEVLSMYVVLVVLHRAGGETQKKPYIKALAALTMNTGWRLLFIFYLLLLVPDWMRDVSIISSAEKFIPFFITQNMFTSFIIFTGFQYLQYVYKPILYIEERIQLLDAIVPQRTLPILKTGMMTLLVMTYAALEFVL